MRIKLRRQCQCCWRLSFVRQLQICCRWRTVMESALQNVCALLVSTFADLKSAITFRYIVCCPVFRWHLITVSVLHLSDSISLQWLASIFWKHFHTVYMFSYMDSISLDYLLSFGNHITAMYLCSSWISFHFCDCPFLGSCLWKCIIHNRRVGINSTPLYSSQSAFKI